MEIHLCIRIAAGFLRNFRTENVLSGVVVFTSVRARTRQPVVTDEAILVGTSLHLLSAHPGRTVASFDVSDLGADAWGSPEFERVSSEVHRLLFGEGGRRTPRSPAPRDTPEVAYV